MSSLTSGPSSASSSKPKINVNLRSTAVKRIMQEAAELAAVDVDEDGFAAAPLENDIFEWHCTMRGVQNSEYDGGLYHLRIVLPPAYPMQAPDIMLMTPNGRFELGKKICIDGLTSFHAGSWQPAWGVRTAILGLRSFWMQSGEALSAIGALDYSKSERKRLANLSREWKCPVCQIRNDQIVPPTSTSTSTAVASAFEAEEQSRNVEVDEAVKEDRDAVHETRKAEEVEARLPENIAVASAINTATAAADGDGDDGLTVRGNTLASANSTLSSMSDGPRPEPHAGMDASTTGVNTNRDMDETKAHDTVLDSPSTSPLTVPLSEIRRRNLPSSQTQTDTSQQPTTQQQTQLLAPPNNHRTRPEPPSRSNSAAQTALLPRRIVPVWLDGLIFIGVTILLLLLSKKLA